MPTRSLLLRVLLSLLLLFAQQQALLHALGHDFEAFSHKGDTGAPHAEACLKCLSFAHLDHAAGPSADCTPAAPIAPCGWALPAAFTSNEPLFAAAYLGRAPPRLS